MIDSEKDIKIARVVEHQAAGQIATVINLNISG